MLLEPLSISIFKKQRVDIVLLAIDSSNNSNKEDIKISIFIQ